MRTLLAQIAVSCLCFGTAFGHGHINAGAIDSNSTGAIDAGDRLALYFEPGTETTGLIDNGGAGIYGSDGFQWNGFTTLTALHQSSFPLEAPYYSSVGAMSGSFLVLELQTVAGPSGADFAYYENGATDPSWVYRAGTGLLSGNGVISLTDSAWFGATPSDPFGHFHGRMFAVSDTGEYTATWIVRDLNGATTGLLDSDPVTTFNVAVPEPGVVGMIGLGFLVLAGRRRRAARHGLSQSARCRPG